ncbi:MAG: hypothetical protein ACU841_07675, partial [Gammaproteobacteria bacterium]
TQQYNQQLQTKIAQYNQDISSIQSETGNQAAMRQKLESKKQQINKELEDVRTGLASAQKDLASLQAFRIAQSARSQELDAEIMKLEANYQQLQQHSYELASMSQRI